MNEELDHLHDKIHALAALCWQLRQDNNALLTQLADSQREQGVLQEKLSITRSRIEQLIARLPGDEE